MGDKKIILPGMRQERTMKLKNEASRNGAQSFSAIGMLQAVNGNIVLRGREGGRDRLYRLDLAWERFNSTNALYTKFLAYGNDAVYQMRQFLHELGSKLLEALRQRQTTAQPIPAWANATTIAELQKTLVTLR